MTMDDIKIRAKKEWDEFNAIKRPRILIGAATCGYAAGAKVVKETIIKELKNNSIEADIYEVGCLGLCYAEPLVDITLPSGLRVIFKNVDSKIAVELVNDFILNNKLKKEFALATVGPQKIDGLPDFYDLPMLKGQVRIVMRNSGFIDPLNINHYIALGGYSAFEKALKMKREDVINEIKNSGLRGRGGAGFPTGNKWELVNRVKSDVKYVICNADEGDPGAFMDRLVLESDPHSVLEGLLIAGYAIGANTGYIYVRAEYPLAVKRLKIAIEQMKEIGLIGKNIFDTDFSFTIKIFEGAGAFVCGEETALIASMEGKRGMPRPKPPYPVEKGLFGKPTCINNVETLANVPEILNKGAEWFSSFGTDKSKGTKTFALAGKIKRTGLIEVPMGIKLKDIIYEIGGGILNDKKLKGVQTGGPSGGCLPADFIDIQVDYEELMKAGSIMGSGGMIILDENTCMVDLARYFIEFTYKESCGKCSPCRIGSRQLLNLLTEITEGKGTIEHLKKLEIVADTVKKGSLCGLGQTLPNPVLSTLKYFREEYEKHVIDKKCPAFVCRGLIKYEIIPEKCVGCTLCFTNCPAKAIIGKKKEVHKIIQEKCIKCGICFQVCKFDAIKKS